MEHLALNYYPFTIHIEVFNDIYIVKCCLVLYLNAWAVGLRLHFSVGDGSILRRQGGFLLLTVWDTVKILYAFLHGKGFDSLIWSFFS